MPTDRLREVVSAVADKKDASFPGRCQQVHLHPQIIQPWQGVLTDPARLRSGGSRTELPQEKAIGAAGRDPAYYPLEKAAALEFSREKSTCKVELCHGIYSHVSCLRKITNALALGIEAFLSEDRLSPTLGLLGHYTGSVVSATAQVDCQRASITSLQKLSSNATLSADFSYQGAYRQPASSIGYECRWSQGRLHLHVESDGRIRGDWEDRFGDMVRVFAHAEVKDFRKSYDISIGVKVAGRA
eukprot:jgi/Mesvir1/2626/Mv16239-RA.1